MSLTIEGSPRNTDYSHSQNASQVHQPGDTQPLPPQLGPQTSCSGLSGANQDPQAGYLDSQGASQSPQTDSLIPEAGFPGAIQDRLPIQSQPKYNCPNPLGAVPRMPNPLCPWDGPPGLEWLDQVDLILVHQQVEILEVLTTFECNSKYEIKNSLGQRIYLVVEDTHWAIRYFCGKYRPFTLKICDNLGREVATVERSLTCKGCSCPCCSHETEIQAPPGVPIGYVKKMCLPWQDKFIVQNEKREDVLEIMGFCVLCRYCTDIDFEVKSLNEESVVGKISKHWTGFVQEFFTNADNFTVKFRVGLDVKLKVVMLGACLLIDFVYFEKKRKSFFKLI
ncbi:phospholipid scramblase 2-like [Octodon degus]|uniref:Phospholipid scramblase n=1 Tax=Octodon degus TaxID=10160 RepID=A0A6P6E8V7_OCTDE|nr:phospholipid scramblase 2-like [Octodon degus]